MEFKHKAISNELVEQIDEMVKKIKDSFGINLTKINASKIIAWKSKSYKIQLNEKKLIDILGGKI